MMNPVSKNTEQKILLVLLVKLLGRTTGNKWLYPEAFFLTKALVSNFKWYSYKIKNPYGLKNKTVKNKRSIKI